MDFIGLVIEDVKLKRFTADRLAQPRPTHKQKSERVFSFLFLIGSKVVGWSDELDYKYKGRKQYGTRNITRTTKPKCL